MSCPAIGAIDRGNAGCVRGGRGHITRSTRPHYPVLVPTHDTLPSPPAGRRAGHPRRRLRPARALREKAAKLGANGVILLNARAVSTHAGPNVGVILGGSKEGSSTVVIGDGDRQVKEFERAVAIRYEVEPAVAQSTGAAAPR